MNIQGLTSIDFTMLKSLSLRASEEQLKAIEQLFYGERLRRITNRAVKDLKTGD